MQSRIPLRLLPSRGSADFLTVTLSFKNPYKLMFINCTDICVTYSRPGILVLINDADWELEGEAAYVLQPKDNILFVSTLHGG